MHPSVGLLITCIRYSTTGSLKPPIGLAAGGLHAKIVDLLLPIVVIYLDKGSECSWKPISTALAREWTSSSPLSLLSIRSKGRLSPILLAIRSPWTNRYGNCSMV